MEELTREVEAMEEMNAGHVVDLAFAQNAEVRERPAAPLTQEQKALLKRTLSAVELTDDEFVLYLTVAARLGLDPLTRQIVPAKFYDSRTKKKEMVLITAVAGMRAVSQRSGLDDGCDGPLFTQDGLNWSRVWLDDRVPPTAAQFTVFRRGAAHPYTAVVKYSEFVQTEQDGTPKKFWRQMPAHMLGKCSEALARRMAFADKLTGVYAPEEFSATSTDNVIDAPGRAPQGISAPPPRVTGPAPDSSPGAARSHLWNTLPKDRRPAPQAMRAIEDKGGIPAQVDFLIQHHDGICGPECPHVTPEIRALAAPDTGVEFEL
ncbi:MAG: phage recombination protein Bet [Candidatus Dormibacteraeota bacterium]|nr:phage recombination protein Bet [Candidatus Dormibacteraeota bacterium]